MMDRVSHAEHPHRIGRAIAIGALLAFFFVEGVAADTVALVADRLIEEAEELGISPLTRKRYGTAYHPATIYPTLETIRNH